MDAFLFLLAAVLLGGFYAHALNRLDESALFVGYVVAELFGLAAGVLLCHIAVTGA